MANEYSTRKLNASSEKIVLVRLKPARYITSDLTLDSGTTYSMTFPFSSLVAIKVDGTTYSSVTSAPSSGEYWFTSSSGSLKINFGAAIGTKVVIAYYYLFYTNRVNRSWYENPESTSSTPRVWQGRLEQIPSFQLSQKDVVSGFLDIGSSPINLINVDNDFQQYLTDNDSFFNKDIDVWSALDTLEHIKKLYSGKITEVSLSSESVTLNVDSALSKLNGTYFSNTTWLKSSFNTTTYPNVGENDINKPIPKFFSKVTYHNSPLIYPSSTSLGGLGSSFKLGDAPLAVNTNPSSTAATNTNREWTCYVANSTSGDFSDGISAVTNHGLGSWTIDLDGLDSSWFQYGDNIYINSTTNFGYVESRPTSYQVRIWVTGAYVVTSADTIYRPEISVVQIIDNAEAKNGLPIRLELVYTRDYTFSTDSNGVRKITLVNNFEANHSEYTGPSHKDVSVMYKAWNDDSLAHGDIVNTLLSAAGLTLDSTSKTTANTTDIDLAFSVPFKGSAEFPTISEILAKILSTTLGVLALGSDFEIEYSLLNAPSAGTTTTNENKIMEGSFNQELDYKDVCSEIRYFNPHGYRYKDVFATLYDTIDTDNDVSNKVKYLHDVTRLKEVEHVAADTTNTFTRLKNLLYERRCYYNFTTKGQHFESILGEDITLSREDLVGSSTTKNVTIIEIEKQSNSTTLKCTDLLGL